MYIEKLLLRREGEPPLKRPTATQTISSASEASQTQDFATQTSLSTSSSIDLTSTSTSATTTTSMSSSTSSSISSSNPTASQNQISTVSPPSSSATTHTLSRAQIFIIIASVLAFVFIAFIVGRIVLRRRRHKKQQATLLANLSKSGLSSNRSSISAEPGLLPGRPGKVRNKGSIDHTCNEDINVSMQRPQPAIVLERGVHPDSVFVSPVSQNEVNARFSQVSALSNDVHGHHSEETMGRF